jgi:beta-lactamase regulating signal transducer with metallopeptidase domain
VRLDRANRSFLACMLLALLLGAFVLCGALGGVLVPLVAVRASRGQLGGVAELAPALAFAAVTAIGLGLGVRALALQLVASSRLARRVRALAVAGSEQLSQAVVASGLDGRVVVVDAPVAFSFVYGLLTPRVAISRGLLRSTTPAELRAILEHERYHVCNLDPLKVVLLRALAAALFFMPALDWLCGHYLSGRELAADRRAVAVCGRRPLAGALLKVLGGPAWDGLPLAAAIGEREVLDARLAQLESGLEPRPQALSLRGLALSLLSVAALLAVFLASVSAFGGGQAVHRVTGSGLAGATLLESLICTVPFAGAGLLLFSVIALRARRPLRLCDPRVKHLPLRP